MAKTTKFHWSLGVHTSFRNEHQSVYRDNALGVQKETLVPYRNGQPCEGKSYYYIDGDEREFRSEEELMAALREAENAQT